MDIPFGCLSHFSRNRDGKRRERQSVSCRMYLLIVLLLFPQVRGFVSNTYNGFDSCGEDGWICNQLFARTEITFDCSLSRSRNARLWIWTARLPNGIKKVTARNCADLELHVDCTRAYRDTKIEEFRLINIGSLTLLQPTNTYEFLHDNSPVPHLPPYFHMENIGVVNFYKGLFRGKDNSCSYNSGVMKKMVMKNVHVANVEEGSFNCELDEIHWENVTFGKIEPGAMKINATSLSIENSHIGVMQGKAMVFKGKNVSLTGNRFSEIGPGSLVAYSDSFNFTRNKINDLMSRGLIVQATHISLEDNVIAELGKEALAAVSPAYYITDRIPIAFLFSYKFTGNEILLMSRFSLHPDWKSYSELTCSKITIDNNKFNCDCENLVWLRQLKQTGYEDSKGFYELLLNTTHHCGTSSNCSLSAIIPYVCRNDSNITVQCAGLNEKENFDDVNFNDTEVDAVTYGIKGDTGSKDNDTLTWQGSYSGNDDSQMILDKSYYTDRSHGDGASGFNAYLWVVIVIAVVVKAVCLLAAAAWCIQRRKRYNTVEIYKYENTNDSDNLITHPRPHSPAECENPSFNE